MRCLDFGKYKTRPGQMCVCVCVVVCACCVFAVRMCVSGCMYNAIQDHISTRTEGIKGVLNMERRSPLT